MRSRAFIRTSDERQDQVTQETAIARHEAERGYTPSGAPYLLDGSAYHGKQLRLLESAIADMLAGEYDVLVCSASSRVWRGKSAARAVVMFEDAEESGGRFDFIGESHLNTNPAMPKQAMDAMRMAAFGANHLESAMKAERQRNMLAMHSATGAVSNQGPWGTTIEGPKHGKYLAATDEARELIPEVVRRIIDGDTTSGIGADLGLTARQVQRIVANGSAYADLDVISHSDAQAARAALRSRGRRGGRPTTQDPALLVPRCPCGGKMYRVFNNAAGGARVPYYRCWDKCGRLAIPAGDLDALVCEVMSADTAPHMTRVWVAGSDAADRAAKLRADAMRAYAAGDKARFLDLDAQADALDARPEVRARWAQRMSCGCEALAVEHLAGAHEYVTEGQHFASLDGARRDYLRSWVITAELVDGEAHAVIVPAALG